MSAKEDKPASNSQVLEVCSAIESRALASSKDSSKSDGIDAFSPTSGDARESETLPRRVGSIAQPLSSQQRLLELLRSYAGPSTPSCLALDVSREPRCWTVPNLCVSLAAFIDLLFTRRVRSVCYARPLAKCHLIN